MYKDYHWKIISISVLKFTNLFPENILLHICMSAYVYVTYTDGHKIILVANFMQAGNQPAVSMIAT